MADQEAIIGAMLDAASAGDDDLLDTLAGMAGEDEPAPLPGMGDPTAPHVQQAAQRIEERMWQAVHAGLHPRQFGEWDEAKHKRDKGKFAKKAGGPSEKKEKAETERRAKKEEVQAKYDTLGRKKGQRAATGEQRQASHARAKEMLAGKEKLTSAHIDELHGHLMNLSVDEIHALKKEGGVSASGRKAELARKVAERLIAGVKEEAKKGPAKKQKEAKEAKPAKGKPAAPAPAKPAPAPREMHLSPAGQVRYTTPGQPTPAGHTSLGTDPATHKLALAKLAAGASPKGVIAQHGAKKQGEGAPAPAPSADPMAGHPLAGKSKEEAAQVLTRDGSRTSPSTDPWGLVKRPVPANHEAVQADVLEALDAAKKRSSFDRPRIGDVYDRVRQKHPGLSLLDFQTSLVRMQQERTIRLDPFTGPVPTMPRPDTAIPLDREPKYYLDTA